MNRIKRPRFREHPKPQHLFAHVPSSHIGDRGRRWINISNTDRGESIKGTHLAYTGSQHLLPPWGFPSTDGTLAPQVQFGTPTPSGRL